MSATDATAPGAAPDTAVPVAADTPSRVRVAAEFFRSAEGYAALQGFAGSVMVTFGGLGAGSTRRQDPLLEEAHLSWLRFGHGYILSTLAVWVGVLMMITAWVRLGRATISDSESVSLNELRVIVGIWVFPLLFAVPMFSRDAYSYLAQGALLRDGFDPYKVGPVANPGELLDNVSVIWTTTAAPYGPFFLLIGRAVTTLTGDNVVAGTIAMRLAMLPGLALMLWAIPHLARHLGGRPTVALWLAVLNPLVLVHLVGGVHNELLMVGFMAAGIALVLEHQHSAGIALVAVAVAIKATAAIALPFLVWIWLLHERQRRAELNEGPIPHPAVLFAKITAFGVAVFAAVFASASLIAGVGLGWMTALSGSQKIINWLSLPTLVAHMLTTFGNLEFYDVIDITRGIGGAVLIVLLGWAWWRFRHTEREAVLGIVVALAAIIVLSPAVLPWYYSWPLALLAGFALSTSTLMVLVGLCTWLMLAWKPDGDLGLYNPVHMLLATAVAGLAAWSLRQPDPLRLGSPPTAKQLPAPGLADGAAAP